MIIELIWINTEHWTHKIRKYTILFEARTKTKMLFKVQEVYEVWNENYLLAVQRNSPWTECYHHQHAADIHWVHDRIIL